MYKSWELIDDHESALSVVAYTQSVVRVVAFWTFDVYENYLLLWVPSNIIKFAPELGFGMTTCLCCPRIVLEVLDLLVFIEGTRSNLFSSNWREHTSPLTDYHAVHIYAGGHFVYYDPWERCKLSEPVAHSGSYATYTCPDYVPSC